MTTTHGRIGRLLGVAGLACLAGVLMGAPSTMADAPPANGDVAQRWSGEVWQTALKGDREALRAHLAAMPDAIAAHEGAVRFRSAVEQFSANEVKARAVRDDSRAKALEEMKSFAAAEDLSQALRKAVEVQTLSDSLDEVLADPEAQKVIDAATALVPNVEADQDWLYAQELLFRLRTLYEDTSHHAEHQRYADELDWVNQRVALLARYAPHRLHELRERRAARLGEEPVGPFNPAMAESWEDRLKGVDARLLKEALRTAAAEHIEVQGWKPLLKGGLESLKILATTRSLDETFPSLREAERVSRWVEHIDNELRVLERADSNPDNFTLSRILDGLVKVNAETLQLKPSVIYREFGDGAMDELDEFSEIVWPEKLSRFNQSTEGKFIGVGILIRHNESQEIVVVNPLEGTPAYFGGIKPEDVIVSVNGESTVGWSLNDAVDRITGEPNTKVTLSLRRENQAETLHVALDRKEIKLPSVMGWWKRDLEADGEPVWDWFVDPGSRIAYVRLTQFTDQTYHDLQKAWREMNAVGRPSGLILDLRYNPGGLLSSAVQISNLFIRNGVIVSGEDKHGNRAWPDQRANPSRAEMNGVPTVVLINKGSASASEIVSGCLQAYGAAVILGERSYGKGSVQTVHQTASNARLKLTTQYYRLPAKPGEDKGRLVHKRPGADEWGVDPDIMVTMTPDQIVKSLELRQLADVIPQDPDGTLKPDSPDRPEVAKLLVEGLDPQLETALLILQARALGELNQGDTRQAAIERSSGS